ncbi:hypothetical protein C5167_033299 [Papaver somniferum]|uniref:S-protein homolog n=1 Tax=Papaver somniferum TaxID=3469 RepID=A0A4Y7KDS8_PAPSO|nr:hypothetical protein C5167_033299 [Papaver somniferum]
MGISSAGKLFTFKQPIQFQNHLDQGTPLSIHCGSSRTDFGKNILQPEEEFKWKFVPFPLEKAICNVNAYLAIYGPWGLWCAKMD